MHNWLSMGVSALNVPSVNKVALRRIRHPAIRRPAIRRRSLRVREISISRVMSADLSNLVGVIAIALQPEKAKKNTRKVFLTNAPHDLPIIGHPTGATGTTIRTNNFFERGHPPYSRYQWRLLRTIFFAIAPLGATGAKEL